MALHPTDAAPSPPAPAGPSPRAVTLCVPAGALVAAGAVVAVTLAVAVAVLASWWLGAATPGVLGGQGPPWWLAPGLRAVRDVAGALTLGLLLLTAGVASGVGDPGSAAAPPWTAARGGVRAAALAAVVAALAGAAHVVVATADLSSRPLTAPGLGPDLWAGLQVVGGLRMLAYAAVALLVVAAVATRARHRRTLQRLAVVAALAAALVGVGGHAAGHEAVVGALAVHVLAASAWAGGLGALLVLRATTGDDVAALLPGWSRLAGLCFVAVAVSGVGAVVLRWVDGTPTSTWLLLAGAKTAVLLALAVVGHRQRLRVVARARVGRPVPWPELLRLSAAELVLMSVAAGTGVALAAGA